MKIVDLTPLKNNDTEFEKLVSAVTEHYKCDWDDAVHESYGKYVKHVQEKEALLSKLYNESESLIRQINELKIDVIIKKANSLCLEADYDF